VQVPDFRQRVKLFLWTFAPHPIVNVVHPGVDNEETHHKLIIQRLQIPLIKLDSSTYDSPPPVPGHILDLDRVLATEADRHIFDPHSGGSGVSRDKLTAARPPLSPDGNPERVMNQSVQGGRLWSSTRMGAAATRSS